MNVPSRLSSKRKIKKVECPVRKDRSNPRGGQRGKPARRRRRVPKSPTTRHPAATKLIRSRHAAPIVLGFVPTWRPCSDQSTHGSTPCHTCGKAKPPANEGTPTHGGCGCRGARWIRVGTTKVAFGFASVPGSRWLLGTLPYTHRFIPPRCPDACPPRARPRVPVISVPGIGCCHVLRSSPTSERSRQQSGSRCLHRWTNLRSSCTRVSRGLHRDATANKS